MSRRVDKLGRVSAVWLFRFRFRLSVEYAAPLYVYHTAWHPECGDKDIGYEEARVDTVLLLARHRIVAARSCRADGDVERPPEVFDRVEAYAAIAVAYDSLPQHVADIDG